jgi:hypothetical protein
MRACHNSLFGQAGSQYELSKLDIGQLRDVAREFQERDRTTTVELKAMNMIDMCVPAGSKPTPGVRADLNHLP